jgi:hypothetical protein
LSFSRSISSDIIHTLSSEELYVNCLKKDCIDDKIFLALRKNSVAFYHRGGRIFLYDLKKFHTHIKYASVIPKQGTDYITENQLSTGQYKLISNFEEKYTHIKENCMLYSRIEDLGVSHLYNKHSYLSNSNVVVLDIEIAFSAQNHAQFQDRIDLLLFNKEKKSLQFVEAKHYSNRDLWSQSSPLILDQIDRYTQQITSKKMEIIREYKQYIQVLNTMFSIDLPSPETIEEKVKLLIFGFDKDQRDGRLKKKITQNPYYKDVDLYAIGEIKRATISKLWRK